MPEKENKKQKKRKKMTLKEKVIIGVSVLLTILLLIAVFLVIPIVDYQYTDSEGNMQTKKVSVSQLSDIMGYSLWDTVFNRDKMKQQTPLIEIDGKLNNSNSYELDSNIKDDFDDGLDMDQLVEGQFTVLFLGFDESRSNTDVIMLVQFDIAANKMNILQIPRDTFVPEYTNFEGGKINSVYTEGVDQDKEAIQRIADTISETLSIPIDRYITTSCTDIVDIVDLVGGVPIDMPYTIYYEPGKTIYEGQQVLSGEKAEWMVRFRHGYDEGDIGRVQAQRIFLAAAMAKACDIGSVQLMSYMATIMEEKWMGSDLSIGEMSSLADFATTVGMDNVTMYMLPGEGYNYYPENWKDYEWYSVWSVHKKAAIDMVNTYFRPYQEDVEDLPIVEAVEEGSYQTTRYDDKVDDLQNIYDGNGDFNG